MKKLIYLMIGILLVLPLISSVTLDSGTVLNATVSNSTMNFSIPVTVDQAVVEDTYILLYNLSYHNQNISVINHSLVNWSTANTNVDSTNFPHASSASSNQIIISNSLTETMNISINITEICDNVGSITYTSSNGNYASTWNVGDYTCDKSGIFTSRGVIQLNITGIETGDNTLDIDYNRQIQTICQDSGSAITTALGIASILFTIVLVGFVITILMLSFKGSIDIGDVVSDLTFDKIIGTVMSVLLTFLFLATLAYVFLEKYCAAIGG